MFIQSSDLHLLKLNFSAQLSHKLCIVTRWVITLRRIFFLIQPKLLPYIHTELCTVSSAEHTCNKCYYYLPIHKTAIIQNCFKHTGTHLPPNILSIPLWLLKKKPQTRRPTKYHKNANSSNKKVCLPSVVHFQYFILLTLLSSSMTLQSRTHPTSTLHWVNPFSFCRSNQMPLREILNHPKVRWGSPFNFFWNSLCFSLVTLITFVHIYLGAHLVNILLPTGLCFMPPVMITALFPTLVQLLA